MITLVETGTMREISIDGKIRRYNWKEYECSECLNRWYNTQHDECPCCGSVADYDSMLQIGFELIGSSYDE